MGSGQFSIGTHEKCFNACNILSDQMKEIGDFCHGTELRQEIDGCSAARDSVNLAMASMTKKWCPTHANIMALAANPDPTSPDPAICKVAYEKRCFDTAPFNTCCASCSSGSS